MLFNSRVLCFIPVAAALLLGSAAGTAYAETTSETNGSGGTPSSTVVIVDPLDGAVFDAPASFTVRIESQDGSLWSIDKVDLKVDGVPTGTSCLSSGVCNLKVVDLPAGEHVLIAVISESQETTDSEPVTITVHDAATTESGASETGADTANTGATETGTASEASSGEAPTSGGEKPETGGEKPETGGASETSGGDGATDNGLVGKGCGCVAGGGNDPLALGVLLVGGALVRRRRA